MRLLLLLAPYLLAQTRHISANIVDEAGKPVDGAWIEYAEPASLKTDAVGRVDIDTKRPSFVIRAPGFRSEFVLVAKLTGSTITIRRSEIQVFPTCPKTSNLLGLLKNRGRFRFANLPSIAAAEEGFDTDYAYRSYALTSDPKFAISHGAGSMWGPGTPLRENIWKSVRYSEIVYRFGGSEVIDGTGEFADGTRWRSLGMFSESLSYISVPADAAKTLDEFLNTACLVDKPWP